MQHLAILSRDATFYAREITKYSFSDLVIIAHTNDPSLIDYAHVDLLLSEPDLAVDILDRCTNLKWLQSTWAGNSPLLKHGKTDYQLTSVKGIFDAPMREYVFAHLLYFERKIAEFTQPKGYWKQPSIGSLAGKCLGVLGAGSIANALVPITSAFDMKIVGLNRRGTADAAFDHVYTFDQIDIFAQQLDYLVCLLPDTRDTDNTVNQQFIDNLPDHCVLLNVGRGNSIDDRALISALKQGKLRAAVLDVFKQEPLANDSEYWHLPNVIVTNHTAAISDPSAVAQIFIDNYKRYTTNQALKYQVDFSRGY